MTCNQRSLLSFGGAAGMIMKEKQDFQLCATRLKALADSDRLRIVTHLFGGQKNVSELADELGEDLVKISHHLGVLRHAGVVEAEKQGRFVVYRLHPEVLLARSNKQQNRIDFGCCSVDLRDKDA
jgi:ArsR family transcriptional regulator